MAEQTAGAGSAAEIARLRREVERLWPGHHAWRARPDSERAGENRALPDGIRAVHDTSQGRYGTLRSHSMR